ncbi:MAG: tRNA preQ1(34) S-adenosylmethionine ribosyltransferase-isomerase QueA [Armatimonadetes bacterium]|nr:tRNA preQ1(34) S-adenosylmethionine ribosyltransferase-isomerase QueA [Armatimonadota bacterium]
MRRDELDYCLPEERIAQTPIEPRDASKLLVLRLSGGSIEHQRFFDLPDLLHPNDLLVVNETRVTAKRLLGRKATGGQVEILLLRPVGDGRWTALVKPGRRLQPGTMVDCGDGLQVCIGDRLGHGERLVDLLGGESELESIGQTPLPPYIRLRLSDPSRYQTIYAQTPGSAAAPTAGLHFTPELIERLKVGGIGFAPVSLEVSADTFRPIQTDLAEEHPMHGERFVVPESTAQAINERKGRLIAVGTTSVRAIESAADESGRVSKMDGETKLYILPGYRFRAVEGMITNFHMPRTTLLGLVGALCGMENLRRAYRAALDNEYRFLSFGDAMLII